MSHPLGYLSGSGAASATVTPLLWFTLIVSIAVSVIIGVLVVWGVLKRRVARTESGGLPDLAIAHAEGGVRWIWIGVAISMVPLLATLVWTVAVLAETGPLPKNPPLTIDIAARRWWWDVGYGSGLQGQAFRTANEIHIPVGVPVLLRLASRDVIHSFWVPKLGGKMDVIPGQTNLAWIEAKTPGRFVGQCAEFCGFQHAHMALEVVAEPPAQFEAWRRAQLGDAPAATSPEGQRGLAVAEARCARCHAIRGTPVRGGAAPDLTHLMSRQTIGAGTLPNNPGALSGWIENPQAVKPGVLMPNQALSGQQLADLRAYLERLK